MPDKEDEQPKFKQLLVSAKVHDDMMLSAAQLTKSGRHCTDTACKEWMQNRRLPVKDEE